MLNFTLIFTNISIEDFLKIKKLKFRVQIQVRKSWIELLRYQIIKES